MLLEGSCHCGAVAFEVQVRADPQDKRFDRYPDETIAQWHERLGLVRS